MIKNGYILKKTYFFIEGQSACSRHFMALIFKHGNPMLMHSNNIYWGVRVLIDIFLFTTIGSLAR